MNIILFLAPASVGLGALGLLAFFWTMRSGQYEDPKGDAERILYDHLDEGPDSDR
ncbi:cbb3-type cytochrome oxidase assembly protein CcoS [Caulobacter sp. RL271]|jgi:cbb3-type cytochrome oxidase maturation protein|uniref:Cbb3-type cytochrome oxidase assembly protein CcoS n=1 Tax=Caulobacter segnis TaxID=88688 RepID=A0ABY4ZP65_9CAUL|nr:cbb3-type cytochrome oxidase assembly protein CcoS [Caulobacter segnis]USQ94470.1 cbb3-type cytochrome oxidase assembly protein CcoS [Caulobacter segnis]